MPGEVGDGFHASPESLHKLQQGLEDLVGAQKKAGAWSAQWVHGDGLDSLELSENAAGGKEAAAALQNFQTRWYFNNHEMFEAAKQMAEAVGATAKSIKENDEMLETSAKKLTNNALLGDPNATKEDLAGKSWKDVATSGRHVVNDVPDQFSQHTFEEHGQHIKQTWQDTSDDSIRTMEKRTGVDLDKGGE